MNSVHLSKLIITRTHRHVIRMSSPRYMCYQPCTEHNWEHNSVSSNSLPEFSFVPGSEPDTGEPERKLRVLAPGSLQSGWDKRLGGILHEIIKEKCKWTRSPTAVPLGHQTSMSWSLQGGCVEKLSLPWSWVCDPTWVDRGKKWQTGGRARATE